MNDAEAGTRRRAPGVKLGLVFVAVYAVVAVTSLGGGHRGRPLFDGFAPPPPYRWVNPPKAFASGNEAPKPSTIEVPLGPTGSAVASGSSSDGQVILTFPAGAFAAHPPDNKVIVTVTPLDPGTLGPPPTGVNADGNAYRLEFAYDVTKQAPPMLAKAADSFLVVPQPAQTLLFSSDAKTWDALPFRPVADPTQIGGAFLLPGYFLPVAPPVAAASAGSPASGGSVGGTLAAMAGLAVLLWGVPLGWRALRGSTES